jgi:hypothetical protein
MSEIVEMWQSYRFRKIHGNSTIYNVGDFAFAIFRIAASGKVIYLGSSKISSVNSAES